MADIKASKSGVQLPRQTFASKAQMSDVGYAKNNNAIIPDSEQSYFNVSAAQIRSLPVTTAIRILTRVDGNFSAALNSYLRLGVASGFKVTGYTAGTHLFDPAATLAAQSILASLDTLYDYTLGFSSKQSLTGLLETLLKEVLQTGGCMGELVINKFRLPEMIVSIPLNKIQWVSMSDGSRFPRQLSVSGQNIDLDFPTIFYAATAQQSNSIFPRSPFESALNMLFRYQDMLEDIFKVVRRSGHTRIVVKVLQDAIKRIAPLETQNDPVKMAAFFDTVRTDIEKVLNDLNPEDALVLFDTAEATSISAKGDKADYASLLETMSGMLACSLKTMPSVLGMRIGGSQSLSNTESLVFLKLVEGARVPVETVMSRALTLGVRLLAGTDSYVKFEFNSVELRPDAELSAHRSVDQQNILRKLSLGQISDDEAAHLQGCFPRPPGAPNLSGTGFMSETSVVTQPKDMQTNKDGSQQSTMNESPKKGAPKSNGGGNPNG